MAVVIGTVSICVCCVSVTTAVWLLHSHVVEALSVWIKQRLVCPTEQCFWLSEVTFLADSVSEEWADAQTFPTCWNIHGYHDICWEDLSCGDSQKSFWLLNSWQAQVGRRRCRWLEAGWYWNNRGHLSGPLFVWLIKISEKLHQNKQNPLCIYLFVAGVTFQLTLVSLFK